VPDASYAALADRYGYAAERVLAVAGERPDLAEPILPGLPDLICEALYAVRHEQAGSLADVLMRRTRLGILAGRALVGEEERAARRAAKAMGGELGWDEARIEVEVAGFRDQASFQDAGALVP
jgi:glycerol-3-phosphate dehydrogenase